MPIKPNGYELLFDINHEALVEKVDAAIREGWQPTGGVSVTEGIENGKPTGYTLYGQAIFKLS